MMVMMIDDDDDDGDESVAGHIGVTPVRAYAKSNRDPGGRGLLFALLRGGATDAVPWLILPVIICLSQRLSHASLSKSRIKVKPRMAQYISFGSLDRT